MLFAGCLLCERAVKHMHLTPEGDTPYDYGFPLPEFTATHRDEGGEG